MEGPAILSGAAKAATYNMVLQFLLRILTFVLNAFILRFVSQDTLGIVNVRLTLLYSTSVFLAKEAFDRACLSKGQKRDWVQVINLLWCTVPLAVLCTTILSLVWIHLLESPIAPQYPLGVCCFALSCVIEMFAEPLFVVGQSFMFVRLKVVILGLSQGLKCVMTVILILLNPNGGILNFCIAQVIFSVGYTAMYHAYFVHFTLSNNKKDDDFPLRSVQDIFPRKLKDKPIIDHQLASLTLSFFKQSFLKQILTEGEKYVMTFFNVLSFGDQGIYDVINNLGSLAARFIFLPVEENSYLFFSQMLMRGVPANEQKKDSLQLSVRVLGVVLKLVSLIGIIIVVFGYSNSFLALHLYGGSLLTSGNGPTLLRWYCLYVLIIAINGVTEAFVFAAMSKEDVDKYNKKMLLFSALFLFSSWLFTHFIGSVGFILANCLNMSARIIHSIFFIQAYFKSTTFEPLREIVPSLSVFSSLFGSLVVTAISEAMLCADDDSSLQQKLMHILITGVCLLTVLAAVLFTERDLIDTVRKHLRRKNDNESKLLKSKES